MMTTAVSEGPAQPLSQWQRVLYIFFSPTKTYVDLRRDGSWWLPFAITVVVSFCFLFTVQERVGWETVAHNALRLSAQRQRQMEMMPEEQVARVERTTAQIIAYTSYASPAIGLLVAAAAAALLMAVLNLACGGKATYGQMLAVYFYSTLPVNLKYLLAVVALYAGVNPDQFDLRNPIGSNLGFYLRPETSPGLMSLATQAGVFTVWGLVLFSIGSAIVAGVSRRQAAIAVTTLWAAMVLLMAGAAMMGGSR